MNQQRSRRFRASQEAAEKEKEKEEAIALFAGRTTSLGLVVACLSNNVTNLSPHFLLYIAMGHPVSDETKNKKAWDSNAITPGPFIHSFS